MIIVRIGNEIFRNPQSIRTDRAFMGGYNLAAVFVKDSGGKEKCFPIPDTEGTTKQDFIQLAEAINKKISKRCAESPLPHVVINLDEIISAFWGWNI